MRKHQLYSTRCIKKSAQILEVTICFEQLQRGHEIVHAAIPEYIHVGVQNRLLFSCTLLLVFKLVQLLVLVCHIFVYSLYFAKCYYYASMQK